MLSMEGTGVEEDGHNEITANMVICLDARRRCAVMLSNDVRAERIYPELARRVLGENGTPWAREYDFTPPH